MISEIATAVLVALICWAYQAIKPPSPRKCGSPEGPPVTAPRVELSDGRHIAYREMGISKQEARYKIIVIHGLFSNRNQFLPLSQVYKFRVKSLEEKPISIKFRLPAKGGLPFDCLGFDLMKRRGDPGETPSLHLMGKEFMEKLGLYILFFDRAGYGESDPNPKRNIRSEALDIEELADKLQLGSKFYVVGFSIGTFPVWSCLKLAGAALVVPNTNFYWPQFPARLANQCFKRLPLRDQWTIRVAHYTPWLFNWWMTQKLFPSLSLAGGADSFSRTDIQILKKLEEIIRVSKQGCIPQGVYVSVYQDMMAANGKWEFDPMEITNPFPTNEGSVHMWQGGEDKIAAVPLNRYISEKLPWIRYHEIPDGGHFIFQDEETCEGIFKSVLFG
ncbi:hypothetical protein RJ640_022556 [Escallonia rubra]|uniref:AB hydrolase-1 domain-containing protein n=1 Tax=Escallonia rubra TaxID=112253 RepID=A0AA88SG98_9ASTE|nr:hypothetical protein RJ640_022556 [Escallonia rubra]